MERASTDPYSEHEEVDEFLANPLSQGPESSHAAFRSPILRTDGGRTMPTSVVIHVKVELTEGMVRKKVLFAITGEDQFGAFECKRSHGDLCRLRSALRWKWPGVVLPLLPGKKRFGNTESLERQRDAIEDFLVITTAVDYIGNSEDYQTFLRAPGSYEKARAALRIWGLADIASQYTNLFTSTASSSTDAMQRLREEEKYFQMVSEKLVISRRWAKLTVQHYNGFRSAFGELRGGLTWVEESYLQACAAGQHKQVFAESRQDDRTNPYVYPAKWLKAELRLVLSVLEAIRGLLGLEAMRLGKDSRVERSKKDLEQMQSGKQPLQYYLTLRSKAANMQAVERTIDSSRDDAQSMGVILRIASIRLLHEELPRIKASREGAHQLPMQQFEASFRIEQKLLAQTYSEGLD